MKRSLTVVALAAAMLSVGAAARTPPATPIGIMEGSPGAGHRLTIVSAFSCPYCRVLDAQAMPELRGTWLRRGLQIENVPVSISPTDIPASIAATCGDPKGYARRSTILFRAQPDISGNWRGASETARNKALAKPKGSSAPEIGRLAGLIELAPSLGLTKPQMVACLNDPARQAGQVRREKLAGQKWNVEGTPTVFLDGRKIGSAWATVRPALTAALR